MYPAFQLTTPSATSFSLSDLVLAGTAAGLAAAFLLGRYWRSRELTVVQRARERYRLLAEHASDMLSTHAADGTFLYASPALEKLLGVTTASLRGRSPTGFAHPEDIATILAATQKAMRDGHPVLATWRCRRADGTYAWLETNGRAVPEVAADRGAPRFISASRDVTRRKQVEQALRASEQRFRATLETSNLVAVALDSLGNVTFCNESLLVLTGWSRDELLGASWFQRLGDAANEWHRDFIDAMSGAGALRARHEVELSCQGGRVALLAWDGNVLHEANGSISGAAFLGVDITERRSEELALQLLNAITLAIGAAGSFDEAIAQTLRLVGAETGWPYAEFWTLDESTGLLQRAPSDYRAAGERLTELAHCSASLRFAPGDGLAGVAYECRAAEWLADIDAEACTPRLEMARRCGLTDGLAVPVLGADQVVGVLVFFLAERQQRDDRYVQIVTVVANQLGALILRKRAEEQLRLEQERFKSAFENSGIGMALVAPDGRWLRVNRAVCAIVGYGEDELLASTFQDITHPDDLETDVALVQRVLAGEMTSYHLAKRYMHRDGHVVWVQLTVSLVRDRIGLPLYFISQIEDVSEAKAAEAALRESETRLRTIVESMDEGLVITDRDERVQFTNRRFAEMLGYLPEELLGQPAEALVVSTVDREELRARVQRRHSGAAERYELEFVRRDGSLLATEVGAVPLGDADGKIIGSLSTITDIEARKKHEAEILRARDAAESANRAKSEFLARMSHELRTPLNAVIGFSRLLLKKSGVTIGPEELKFLERIGANGQHLLNLINDILDLSRIEAGRLDVALETTAIVPLVREVVAQLELTASSKGLRLTCELPAAEITAELDSLRLRQVLINLIGNAVKFTEKGSVVVRLIADAGGRPVRLDIIDTGVGIPADRLAAVFEPFEQADASTSRKHGGTGLGLSISRAFCEAMGLGLTMQSDLGHGTTSTIEFGDTPLEQAA